MGPPVDPISMTVVSHMGSILQQLQGISRSQTELRLIFWLLIFTPQVLLHLSHENVAGTGSIIHLIF